MKLQSNIAIALLGSALALAGQAAHAEAAYGYQSTGAGGVSASAKVNIKINVPKLILLRVGDDNTAVNTVSFDMTPTWTGGPTSLTSGGVSTNTSWDGSAPSFSATGTGNTMSAWAWTNASGATLTVATTTAMAPAGGPGLSNITVTAAAGGNLNHPGANLGSPSSTTLTPGTAHTASWQYNLTVPSPMTWTAGTYNATVTYTASAL